MSERKIDEDYWIDAMKHRQSNDCEIDRLISIGKGYYLSELKYEAECDNKESVNLKDFDFIYFIKNAKRPFGNKNIEQSIMYNLGWDWDRRLVSESEPKWVIREAEQIYNELIKYLEYTKEMY